MDKRGGAERIRFNERMNPLETPGKNSNQVATGEMMYTRGLVNPWIVVCYSQISLKKKA